MGHVLLKRTNSNDADFKMLIVLLDNNLNEINGEIMAYYSPHNLLDFIETVIVAYIGEQPVGCGCFKKFDKNSIEIKRMYTNPQVRGKGVATAVLKELELWATELGYNNAVLETGTRHDEAISLYHRLGYVDMEKYEPYVDMDDSVCMQKLLQK